MGKFEPKIDGSGEILKFDENHWISFNPDVREVLARIFASLTGIHDDNESGAETALCQSEPRCFLILKGDHREAFGKAAQEGWDACLRLYDILKDEWRSDWSEDGPLFTDFAN